LLAASDGPIAQVYPDNAILCHQDTCPDAEKAVVKHALWHRLLAVEPQGVSDMMSPAAREYDLLISGFAYFSCRQSGSRASLPIPHRRGGRPLSCRRIAADRPGDAIADEYSLTGLRFNEAQTSVAL
jgi:hypothetical protein